MTELLSVLAQEPRARRFLLANLQSAIGTHAAAIGLVVLAYRRMHSPWAITLILLAEFLPSMVLGPLLGAAADRWSRRGCAITADVLRAGTFVAIGLVHSFALTFVLALVAGFGTALFSPAVLAALPSLAAPERNAAVMSVYGIGRDFGRTVGPLLAAIAFPLIGVGNVMIVNGATFAVSALVIASVRFGPMTEEPAPSTYRQLLREAREGLRITARTPGVNIVLWTSTAVIVYAAMVNVGELLLARRIGLGASGYAALMVFVGVGLVAGSLTGARAAPLASMKVRYLAGTFVIALAVLELSFAGSFVVAMIGFFGAGFGNGVVNVYERLIFHAALPLSVMSRAFAVLDTVGGWGFTVAFLGAGGIIAALGVRGLFAVAGGLGLVVFVLALVAFRGVWRREDATAPAAVGAAD